MQLGLSWLSYALILFEHKSEADVNICKNDESVKRRNAGEIKHA